MISLVNAQSFRARYLEEILDHAGLPWSHFDGAHLEGVIIVHAGTRLESEVRERITASVERGAALVTVGGTAGLDDLVGAHDGESLPEGYIVNPSKSHVITTVAHEVLHVFEGRSLRASSGSALADVENGGSAIVVNRPGEGATVAIGPDIVWSVAHIQTGISVTQDADPAPDGTALLNEGILKAEDGMVLDWHRDRQQTWDGTPLPTDMLGIDANYPNGDTPWFSVPIADELRDILLRSIAWAAAETKMPLAMVDIWPEGIDAVGTISHDSDLNIDDSAHRALWLLWRAGVKSTWCHMWGPNYQDVYDESTFQKVTDAGHEFAMHYNAFDKDGGSWGQDHFRWQLNFVKNESGIEDLTSNKNHYTRWEGHTEFFHWLLEEGFTLDQSRGPSKKGTVGYPLGSSLPWKPMDAETGKILNIYELPFQFQDLWLTTPPYMRKTTIEQAIKHRGVAHFLFHQVHLLRQDSVAEEFLNTIEVGREAGLEWWTSREIATWETARREISLSINGDSLSIQNADTDAKAVVLEMVHDGSTGEFERFGQQWRMAKA